MTGSEKIDIIKALESGASIEYSNHLGSKWLDYCKSRDGDLNFQDYKYRLKPGLREFNGALEFIEALEKHGGYLKVYDESTKKYHYVKPSDVSDSGVTYICLSKNVLVPYKTLLDRIILFYDGTPCGIMGGL